MTLITSYPQLPSPDDNDVLLVVDVSDPTQSPAGTTKQTTVGALPSSGGGGAVASVNGHTGTVVLAASDVGADAAGAASAAQSTAETYADTNKLAKSANLSDVASPSTARTNLGLASAATQPSSAFDAAGAAATAQTAAEAASLPLPTGGTYPGGTTTFLRADQTWAVPAGGGGGSPYIQASGDTTGATDTPVLQAALTAARTAGGGQVKGQPGGTFYLNAQLVIGSHTTLDMTDCTIIEHAGTNQGMVRNFATTAVATASDGAITAGQSVITTSLGASAVVGQTVTVAGAAAVSGLLFCGLVSAVTSTTITVTNLDGTGLTAGTTVSGAAVSLFTRDNNVAVKGGYWQAGANQPAVIGNFRLAHLDHYTIEFQGFSSTIAGYCVSTFDITDGLATLRNLNTTTTGSDGIHVAGPCYGLVIPEVTGKTGDDSVSLTASDYPTGTTTGETSGNIIGVRIGTIDTTSGFTALKIIAGAGNLVDDVKVYGGIRGLPASGIWIGDDVNQASTTGGTYGNIDLGQVEVRPTGAAQIFLRSPAAKRISASIDYGVAGITEVVQITGTSTVTIEELVLTGAVGIAGSAYLVFHNATSVTISNLVITNFNMDATGSSGFVKLAVAATVNQIDLNSCRLSVPSNGIAVWTAVAGSTINRLNITGGSYTLNNMIQDGATAAVVTTFSGGMVYTGKYGVQVGSGGATGNKTYIFAGCNFTVSGAGDASVIWTNLATCILRGDLIALSGALLHRQAGTETVESFGPQLPLDISALTQVAGSMATNTNGSVSPGTGPVVSDGATWWPLHDQKPWQFDVTTYGAKGDGKVVIDGAMTNGSPNLACTTSTPFASGDVGKHVIVNGAGGTGTALVATIATFTDSGHVVLNASAAATVTGAAVMWGSDDTAAFQAAINAAAAYMNTHGYAQVWKPVPPGGVFYMIAGALVTTGSANSQLTIPNPSATAAQGHLDFDSAAGPGRLPMWTLTYPQVAGAIVSTGIWDNAGDYVTNYNGSGPSAVLGTTPAYPELLTQVDGLPAFANLSVTVRNWTVVVPSATHGLGYTGVNLGGAGKGEFDHCAALLTTNYYVSTGANAFPATGTLSDAESRGLILPYNGNNDQAIARSCAVSGYAFGIQCGEHAYLENPKIVSCWSAFQVSGNDGATSGHLVKIIGASAESCFSGFWIVGVGESGAGTFIDADIDVESMTTLIQDNNSGAGLASLYGEIRVYGSYIASELTPPFPTPVRVRSIGPAFGTGPGAAIVPAVVALTFGASIPVNAALGNVFAVTLTASTGTLANPTNPVDGQAIRVRVIQDSTGTRTLAYGTAYDFGAAGPPTLSTAALAVDILGFEYVASISKWCYLGAGLGF